MKNNKILPVILSGIFALACNGCGVNNSMETLITEVQIESSDDLLISEEQLYDFVVTDEEVAQDKQPNEDSDLKNVCQEISESNNAYGVVFDNVITGNQSKETKAPELKNPNNSVLETKTPDIKVPDTKVSETTNSGNNASETKAPETKVQTQQPSKDKVSETNALESESIHTHQWMAQTTTIHHDAVTEQVWIEDSAAWNESIYENHNVCNGCGMNITGNIDHIYECDPGSYHAERVFVGTITHEATGHYETKVVQAAYDEVVTTGYGCSCGAKK